MLKAMLVDDEALSIKRLRRLLAESGAVEVVEAFHNPLQAYEFAKSQPLDAIFLDISMPGVNGIQLSEMLHAVTGAELVFVTGHDEYAIQAYDRSALDYLIKPVTAERLARTLDRLRKISRPPMPAIPAAAFAEHEDTVEAHALTGHDLSVFVLNGLRMYTGRAPHLPLKLRSPKTEELFAYLVCKGTVSREEAAETLWPELGADKALHNLKTNLYYIRKSLQTTEARFCIEASRNDIVADRDRLYCDAHAFESLCKRISGGAEADDELIDQAAALYAGPLLKGRAYSWADEMSRGLEQAYIRLLETAARLRLEQGKPREALGCYSGILELDAVREDIHYQVISLYIDMGRTADAIRHYRNMELLLRTELGIGPDPRIVERMASIT